MQLEIQKELQKKANPENAKIFQRFFKTGPSEYGEGDLFLGVIVPKIRETAKNHPNLSLYYLKKLLTSPFNEERLCALFILVKQFQSGDEKEKKKIYDFYLSNIKGINSWGLVDTSADKIVGEYLASRSKNPLRCQELCSVML
ncbi:MAG: DNA alkylation repair protein [bacterium]|nr:DNA alkylation repair protein [bacterium]